ncbi:hypothetical protein Val02_03780 [Virgisporangium aliadipatigenens]|uniref:Hsp70 family protein n=1 Tax=Virgisporangium aliadipatigenens TaxID=741659 RepID=A0A8J3YFV7_9ACTN|nr:Hsp70 family protein [Virgisporangium aliadipatigenens]GIJ43492.1 hypothetical protein Val02_03780 [Virgisporangium aliadipatigenens]
MSRGYLLGIDYGTSNTVAVLARPDGPARPLLFDGSPLLPSAVYLDTDGGLLVGRAAVHSARRDPARYEPNPKRGIDEGTVLLGTDEVPVTALIAAVVRTVAAEAHRTVGGAPLDEVVLTCPAGWGNTRRQVLRDAAAAAGFGAVRLVEEPIAAAAHFLHQPDVAVAPGQAVVVYDLGAGTFDVSVVRREPEGFTVLVSDGLPDVGGLDVDAALVDYFGAVLGVRQPEVWARLEEPRTPAERRDRRQLWDDVRTAKELLSRTGSTVVFLSGLDEEATLGREQVEQLAGRLLRRTVDVTRATLRRAGTTAADVAGVFLVGGASRMPAVATLLHRSLGIAPYALEQPELVVAEGSLAAARHGAPQAAEDRQAAPAVWRPDAPGAWGPEGSGPARRPEAPAAPGLPRTRAPAAPSAAGRRGSAAAVSRREGAPAGGAPVPAGQVPVTTLPMHAMRLSLPSGIDGSTMRFEDEDDPDYVAFLERDGGLLLFRSPMEMLRHVVRSNGHPLADHPQWSDLRAQLTDAAVAPDPEDVVDFDVLLYSFEYPPERWLPNLFIAGYSVALDIATAFALTDVLRELAPERLLGRVDDLMRQADQPLAGRKARRQIRDLDAMRVERRWRQVVDALDAVAVWA